MYDKFHKCFKEIVCGGELVSNSALDTITHANLLFADFNAQLATLSDMNPGSKEKEILSTVSANVASSITNILTMQSQIISSFQLYVTTRGVCYLVLLNTFRQIEAHHAMLYYVILCCVCYVILYLFDVILGMK